MQKRHLMLEDYSYAVPAGEKRIKLYNEEAPPAANPLVSRFSNDEYTVAWICAIRKEYVAARAFLDREHILPEYVSPNNDNVYTLGEIGKHNIVIAVLPDGEYGIAAAASVAGDMLSSFPNVRFGLMVGIGGGAPNQKYDIRLGDVVVSAPRDGKGGVLQYNFGKTIQGQKFRETGILNQPPRLLRAAVNDLAAQYEEQGNPLDSTISTILEKKPRLRKHYKRPNQSSDRLYQSGFIHLPKDKSSCAEICGDDQSNLISRPERTEDEDNPAIHYGLIASANQLMKDALVRDRLAAERDVLCFETEAAGLINRFPCLVIRGICDYSDSHKNDKWQGYAVIVAAAYAKDLLRRIPPNKVKAEEKIQNILPELKGLAQAHLNIGQKYLEIKQEAVNRKRSDVQEQCLQMFRLTKSNKDTTYEWYKDRVEDQVEGTCQ